MTGIAKELSAFQAAFRTGELCFFAGSGISYASGLPSVPTLQGAATDALLPDLAPDDHHRIAEHIQPELFYEALIDAVGDRRCLGIWLSLHGHEQAKRDCRAVPTLAHHVIVQYSARFGIPILTTNFDCMFEDAARRLELPFRVYLPDDPPPTGQGPLAICKLHGSIATRDGGPDLNGLWTTATEISTFNAPWVEFIISRMRHLHIAYVGYSGRDIDLFPYVRRAASLPGHRRPFWLSRFDDADPATRQAHSFDPIMVHQFPDAVFAAMGLTSPGGSAPPSRDKVAACVQALGEELRQSITLPPAEQIMFRAMGHFHAGAYREADQSLAAVPAQAIRALSYRRQAHFHLARARHAHERSRYVELGRHAFRALKQALRARAVDEIIHALTVSSESHRMRIPADTYFPSLSLPVLLGLVLTSAHFVMVSGIIRLLLRMSGRSLKTLRPHARHAVLEHRIRFQALLQGIAIAAHDQIRRRLSAAWQRMFETCHHHGYGAGMANCDKFAFRIAPEHGLERANSIYTLFTQRTGLELTTRNRADDAKRNKDLETALKLYDDFFQLAMTSGNTLNAVKALLGKFDTRRQLGLSPIASPQETAAFEHLSQHVEGRLWAGHFRRVHARLGLDSAGTAPAD